MSVAAVAAVPATASASTKKVVSKTSVAAVQSNVANAKTAVKKLKRAVSAGKSTVAKRELKVARSQSAAASRTARRMANRAVTEIGAATAAQALTIAGTQYDALLETLTALVDDGPAQSLIAAAIQPTIAGRTQILETLTALLDDVPASVQPMLASIIAALAAGDATEVVNLDNALNAGSLPDTITGLVSQCLAVATQAIQSGLSMIQGFLPLMPTESQIPLGNILTQVSGVAGNLLPTVLSTVTGLIDTIISALPIVGGGSATAGIGGITGIFGGLLGGLVGGGAGTIPGTGNVGNIISDLLGGLLGGSAGVVGGSPVGGVLSTVTNLINSLLGGLLPSVLPAT
ncbi:MAG TPA: hypothetical protein VGO80_03020 [Solirubrobacteraceae bacterium]|nr:hypothetical protein [Solirubrobacteraceae bacterium]